MLTETGTIIVQNKSGKIIGVCEDAMIMGKSLCFLYERKDYTYGEIEMPWTEPLTDRVRGVKIEKRKKLILKYFRGLEGFREINVN